jgi:2-polyprenyl-3-methyl-5-hydroxy-6-metoxy-1,4-benzoquinol methylase
MSGLPEPWHEAWPPADLDAVPACPVCACSTRTLRLDGVVDNSFRTSPGRWRLWSCADCQSAYLDPRPSAASIHRAYQHYYTHHAPAPPASALRQLHRQLANAYLNRRYGAREQPAHWLGGVMIGAVPYLRRFEDRACRHLPPLPRGGGAVLDVGCGDGAFLALAQRAGWQVLGLEPDAQAAAVAQQQGVPVQVGGLETLAEQQATFDVITLAHVIEHVADPVATLRDCHRLLKPGGQLWLETPNAAGHGLRAFGRHWRGLEAPRHLVLFTPQSLRRAVAEAGFEGLQHPPTPSVRRWMAERSLAIQQGRWPDDTRGLPWRWRLRGWVDDWLDGPGRARGEFLTLVAHKRA